MAYSALELMRQANLEKYGLDVGPEQPELVGSGNDLKSAALRFLHERCEGYRFDEAAAQREAGGGGFEGTSIAPEQIPYNMQMDIDRLCFERELERFIDSGVAADAYTIYYSYLEMLFGHYGKSKKMVELLSEYENNGSSLLMKHRDHYSHSVYVFTLGLAIFETNPTYRASFAEFYKLGDPDGHEAAHFFLTYWGLAALFHDIGYPFELPFEQVISYFEVDSEDRGPGSIYIAYHDLDRLTALTPEATAHLEGIFGRRFTSTNELLAFDLATKLGEEYHFDEEYMLDVVRRKPTAPSDFGYFMDHGWFSSARLYQELVEALGDDGVKAAHVDALSAILMHNSLYKFAIAFYKAKDPAKRGAPFRMELHPLAWLLMLCDELQCWDRTAYGRNSRTELHPMAADFDFSDGAIRGTYYYDAAEGEKIEEFEERYAAWEEGGEQGDPPRLKAYSDMAEKEQRFVRDIESIVDTSAAPLTIKPDIRLADRSRKRTYLSSSNFLHLYDFAVALNARYAHSGDEREVDTEELEHEFEELSLEYQLSNINQAKSFDRYLNAIRCFYTDRPVDFDMLRAFTPEQTAVFAPMEHKRWVMEHASMGWRKGEDYERLAEEHGENARDLRERFRMHKLAMDGSPSEEEIIEHYEGLSEEDKGKDWKPFNSMLELIKKFDGLRIYRLDESA